jgi:hypothetical protein
MPLLRPSPMQVQYMQQQRFLTWPLARFCCRGAAKGKEGGSLSSPSARCCPHPPLILSSEVSIGGGHGAVRHVGGGRGAGRAPPGPHVVRESHAGPPEAEKPLPCLLAGLAGRLPHTPPILCFPCLACP